MNSSLGDIVEQAIRNVLPAQNQGVPFTEQDSLQNALGLDSLAMASLALELEDALGVELETIASHIQEAKTVADVLAVAHSLANKSP